MLDCFENTPFVEVDWVKIIFREKRNNKLREIRAILMNNERDITL